jgi:uncharacterized protein YceK
MKKTLIVLAVMAMSGCSSMHMPSTSSSGSTSSSSMGAGSTDYGSAYNDPYAARGPSEATTKEMYNPYNPYGTFPTPIIGP